MLGFLRLAVGALCTLLPWRFKRAAYRHLLRYVIHETAYVGFSLVLTKYLTMGENARIGHFDVIRGCDSIVCEEAVRVGNLNWISASASPPDGSPGLGEGSVLFFHQGVRTANWQLIRPDNQGRDWLWCVRDDVV